MKEKQFHILLEVPESFPENLAATLQEIEHDRLKAYCVRRPSQPWAGLEWAIPGLIVAYLAKPYFEGFLQEMGKDHYEKVKSWLKELLKRSRNISVTTLSSAENKVNLNNTQSKAISIYIDTKNGQQIKLLFDEELNLSIWQNSLDEILSLVLNNHQSYPHDDLTKMLEGLKTDSRYTIYAFLDKSTKKWRFIDDTGLLNIQREFDKK